MGLFVLAPITAVIDGRVTLVGISTAALDCSSPIVIAKVSCVLDWLLSNTDAYSYQSQKGTPILCTEISVHRIPLRRPQ